eukprot:CAMPEP_0183738744 /NCGR_PEP_ID=MMETSP0737-20130205/55371_1 /TAXON_ID=385413 /ORGANISM="Thalassiosira miniscula, Strain CCMP1093" /LENGTH=172 /DNA_ID=CAMNT_0025973351 /DNA_START=152 /DNA_END=670 /DNA_ORIENTATION=-
MAAHGTTNVLAGEPNNSLDSKSIDDTVKPSTAVDAPPARRRAPSGRRQRAAGNALSNSLRADRRTGIESTKGRLSVSFSDQKGLGAAMIGDILAGFDDGEDEPEKSMEELLGMSGDKDDGEEDFGNKSLSEIGNKSLTSINTRMKLMTIESQRCVTFGLNADDLASDESDED